MEKNKLETPTDWEAFKIFATLHPIEAYDSRSKDFCALMREQGHTISDEEIKDLVNTIRNEEK